MSLLHALNLFGVAVFAVSGVLAAGRKRLDIFGVVVIALVTAIGGGTLRDLLLGRHPIFWFRETEHLLVIVSASFLTLAYLRFRSLPEVSLLIADALGLAVFTITGAQVAAAAELPGSIVVIMGVITGVAGGVVRDVLTGEIPLVFRRGHLYATAAIAGATLYLLLDAAGVPRPLPTLAGVTSVVLLRVASILWGLQLPVFALSGSSDDRAGPGVGDALSEPHAHQRPHGQRRPEKAGSPLHPEQEEPPHHEHRHAHEQDDHRGDGPHAGHDKHAGHSVAMFRDKFWISLLLTLPTIVWGHLLAELIGYEPPRFAGSEWIAPVFGTIVFFYGGRVFLQGAWHELKERLPGMMTLIALAITVAFVFSVAVLLGFPAMALWEELATLITIMILGHWLEMRSIEQASGALDALAKLLPSTATRMTEGGTEEVPLDALREGDLVLVRPGGQVPADGTVLDGASNVNESMITGESRPVDKRTGDTVIAGTVNGNGSLRVRVTGTGAGTALAGIVRLVSQAQSSRSRAQALADRAAFWLTIVAVVAAVVTSVAWTIAGARASFTVERVVTVLVIACPHALGLAIPLVVAISTTLGARSGLLVRDRRGLEEARRLDAVVFDKTGTLTLGEHRVVSVVSDGIAEEEALRIAAAVERDSEHPVARAIVASAAERELPVPPARDFRAVPGHGVEAEVDGRTFRVGGPNLLRRLGITPPPLLVEAAERFAARGQSAVYLIADTQARAVFAVADQVRPESVEAVRRLHEDGIEVVMLTGDSRAVAEAVASQLGIETVFAEVLPEAKAEKVKELQRSGKRVAMVGDGVNDAPALATSDVGIAIGAGTDVAVEAGDVVLVRSDPRDVARIVRLSKATYRKMIQNLWWATGYNIIALPLAAGVLASRGVLLHPALGAVLMSVSTVIVALNAQLLRRADL